MDRPETEAEMIARMQRVTDQLSAAIVSVDCSKADMADLLVAQAMAMMVDEHGARKTAQSMFLFAKSLAAGQDLEDAAVASAAALKKAGAKMN